MCNLKNLFCGKIKNVTSQEKYFYRTTMVAFIRYFVFAISIAFSGLNFEYNFSYSL